MSVLTATAIRADPSGSFTGKGFGPFYFSGTINGVALDVVIAPEGTKRYAMRAGTRNANLTGTVNPVPVTLSIGGDSGARASKD